MPLPTIAAFLFSQLISAPALAWEPDAGRPEASDPHYDLEVLFGEGKYQEGLAEARAQIARTPDDAELYWLAARFLFETAEVFERTDKGIDKESMYEEMLAIADKGLALDPGNPHLLFGRGIARGRLGTTRGVLASLFMAKQVQADWAAAASSGYQYESLDGHEVLPCDADLTLGIFYRLVPDWWIVQVIAGTRGDLDQSLQHLESANQCSPGRIQILKELGVTELCKAQKSDDLSLEGKGRAHLEAALEVPALVNSDRTDHRHIQQLLVDPTMACEYSRDGQADLDREKLERQSTR